MLDVPTDTVTESELNEQPRDKRKDGSINVATWNIQTFNEKTKIIEDFMLKNSIEIMATTETRHKSCTQIDNKFKRHVFFGNTYKSPVGGVGFIIRRELLDATETEVQQGEYENSMFLTIRA